AQDRPRAERMAICVQFSLAWCSSALHIRAARQASTYRRDINMRSIAIIGGGHAGLQLGIGLLQHGYKVCVVTDRDADAIKNGRILSSQGMQKTGLDHERALGLNFWEEEAPKIEFFEFSRR